MVCLTIFLFSFLSMASAQREEEYTDFSGAHAMDKKRGSNEGSGRSFALELINNQLKSNSHKNAQENPNAGGQDSGQWTSSSSNVGTTFVPMAPQIVTELIPTTTYPTITSTAPVPEQPSWTSTPLPSPTTSLATSFSPSVESWVQPSPNPLPNANTAPLAQFSLSSPGQSTTTTSMTLVITSPYPVSAATSTVTTSAALDLSVPTSSPTPGSGGLSTARKASIGIGVTVGILSVTGLVFFFFWRRRRLQQARQQKNHTDKSATFDDENIPSTPFSPTYTRRGRKNITQSISAFSPFLRTHFTSLIAKISPEKDTPPSSASAPEPSPPTPTNEKDTEFSILSASKVEIVHHAHKGEGSIRSIRTRASASSLLSPGAVALPGQSKNGGDSPCSSYPPSPLLRPVSAGAIVGSQSAGGVKMVDVKARLNIALTSNPISPLEERSVGGELDRGRSRRGRGESWPLAD
ncbi:unnamed protein product [Periconia digitata]|uniref:Uncharacterized protein n=1 Tax=Periconia digitata TaxID=1303443 RepID=A0A9W4UPJ8_9PLEO|nr:unnamed protein product [Periconia digitata]